MLQNTKDTVAGWFILAAAIAVPVTIGLLPGATKSTLTPVEPDWSCTTERVPYDTIADGDNGTDEGNYSDDDYESEVVVDGQEGETETCTDNNEVESDRTTVKSEPVSRVVRYTRVYVEPEYEPIGGGAICRDGWRSYSTGRGTCSHHGGVDYWL